MNLAKTNPCGGNMLSVILAQAYSNETSPARLQHIPVLQHIGRVRLLTVDPHTVLFDQPARVSATSGETGLDESCNQIRGIDHLSLRYLVRDLALAELGG